MLSINLYSFININILIYIQSSFAVFIGETAILLHSHFWLLDHLSWIQMLAF